MCYFWSQLLHNPHALVPKAYGCSFIMYVCAADTTVGELENDLVTFQGISVGTRLDNTIWAARENCEVVASHCAWLNRISISLRFIELMQVRKLVLNEFSRIRRDMALYTSIRLAWNGSSKRGSPAGRIGKGEILVASRCGDKHMMPNRHMWRVGRKPVS